MTDPSIVVQTLRDLGITRTEAEVYVATLREANGGPVSGYRVAQSVGKDPANLSKTLASLEKLGAVRTIQEKPRLYIPLPPEEFTDKLMADMKNNRARVLEQLADLQVSPPAGIPMALHDLEQTLHKAAQLLTRCRRELFIFANKKILESLGTSLEALVVSSEVTVKILTVETLNWEGVQEKVIPLPVGFSDPVPIPWIQLVVDRQTWLIATFPSVDAEKSPCGWWSVDPGMALILGAGFEVAMENTVEVSIEIPPVEVLAEELEPELQVEPVAPVEQLENETDSKVESPIEIHDPPSTEEDEEDDGIQFIIRHDEDEDTDNNNQESDPKP